MSTKGFSGARRSRLVVFAVTAIVGSCVEFLFFRPTTPLDGVSILTASAFVAFLLGGRK